MRNWTNWAIVAGYGLGLAACQGDPAKARASSTKTGDSPIERKLAQYTTVRLTTDLEKLTVTLSARAGKDGRLFGSVTSNDIASAVKSAGGPMLDRKRIQLPGHIKTTGSHTVTVDLHPDVVASVPVNVTAVV